MSRLPIVRKDDGKPPLQQSKLRCQSAKKMVIHAILMGESQTDIIEALQKEFGYSEQGAHSVCRRAREDMDKKYQKYTNGVAKRNMMRLEALIEQCYADGKYKECLQAIDMQNKTCNVYQRQETVVTTPTFELKISQ